MKIRKEEFDARMYELRGEMKNMEEDVRRIREAEENRLWQEKYGYHGSSEPRSTASWFDILPFLKNKWFYVILLLFGFGGSLISFVVGIIQLIMRSGS